MSSWMGLVLAALLAVVACESIGPGHEHDQADAVQELGEDDIILINDLLGSPVVELTSSGKPIGHFAAYPFGQARFDSTALTEKYAGTPHDASVSLHAMGARFYAPTLGVWTSADPVSIIDPERLVASDFTAANPYAYAKDSPLLVADRDGHFWHIAVGAGIGALTGGGIEAGRQFWASGHVESWGRIAAAASGGAVSGALTAALPVAGISSFFGTNAVSGAAQGVTQRLVESGGQSAGTLREAVFDAGISVVTAGVMKGGGELVKAAVKRAPSAARALAGAGERSIRSQSVVAGRGSSANLAKGTTLPRNLREQLAVEQAMSDLSVGEALPKIRMNDPRWHGAEGWAKMETVIKSGGREGDIQVHYVKNAASGLVDDFKVVLPGKR